MVSQTRKVPSPSQGKKVIKVVLVGDIAVGKTSLRKRLVSETFSADYLSTLGVDFATKEIQMDDYTMELQVWDIAGQPNYHSVADRFLKNSHGALLVYDVERKETFEYLQDRMKRIIELNKEETPEFLIVGNKIDLKEPEMTTSEINDYFNSKVDYDNHIEVIFTSAKTGENVNEAFKRLGVKVVETKSV